MGSYSPLWGTDYAPVNSKNTARKKIARMLNTPGMQVDREVIRALLGEAPGEDATLYRTQVAHDTNELGGKRAVQLTEIMDRPTTSADVVDINFNVLSYNSQNGAYRPDKSLRA